ncbi:hypothetical protein ACTFIY_005261 [Dictyostelium cf. discoideum]
MKKYNFFFIILIFIHISQKTYSQSNIKLSFLVYDHTPSRNPDFEAANSGRVEKGLVKADLGTDGTPVYCCGSSKKASITSETTFYSWFHNKPGTNLPINKEITLTQSTTNSNIYSYTNNSFFIIDGEGFDDKTKYPNENLYYDTTKKARNFHYCAQTHTQFQYKTGDVFSFTGDDDVWVFINNKLAVDLGGMHPPSSSSVNLDRLGHTDGSTIQITTSLKFVCPYYDGCGVCQGDNSSCCLPSNCDQNPKYTASCIQAKCVNGLCNVPVTSCSSTTPCFDSVCTPFVGCSLVPKNCSSADYCRLDYCNPTLNACQHDIIPDCISCSNIGCLTTDKCFPKSCSTDGNSCITNIKSCDDNNPCTTDTCYNGNCFYLFITDCINCGGNQCFNIDKCNPTTCAADGKSCVQVPVLCDDHNHCTDDSCSNGYCISNHVPNCIDCSDTACITTDFCNVQVCSQDGKSCVSSPKNCNDTSFCTIDSCISPDGTCSHSIPDPKCVSCASTSCTTTDDCFIQICSDDGNSCKSIPKNCDDQNPCTQDSCSNNGVCSYTPIPNCSVCNSTFNCITTDLCQPMVCKGDPDFRCEINQALCNDDNFCTTDSCSGNGICAHTPVDDCLTCSSNIGCITVDKCNPQICSNDNQSCTTGDNGCDKGDKCSISSCESPSGNCKLTPINCNDNDPCTIDSCNPADGTCGHQDINKCAECGQLGCITTNLCEPVSCSITGTECNKTKISCDDNNHCTQDACSIKDGSCYHATINNCIDCANQACITFDACKPKKCGADGNCYEDIVTCDDGNGCTIDSCSNNGTCSNTIIENCVSCNSSFNCITTDFCDPQICSGDPLNLTCINNISMCDDGNYCTTDTCSEFCTKCNETAACIEKDLCQLTHCSAEGDCMSSYINCDDGNPCTHSVCDPETGSCIDTFIEGCSLCSEPGVYCYSQDKCSPLICNDAGNGCVQITPNCSDHLLCTNDTCKDGHCINTPIDNCLECTKTFQPVFSFIDISAMSEIISNDSFGCYSSDKCVHVQCLTDHSCNYTNIVCEPDNSCHDSYCDEGVCYSIPKPNCEVYNSCEPSVCSDNKDSCITKPLDCDDNDECTIDSCSPDTNCTHTRIAGCGRVPTITTTTAIPTTTGIMPHTHYCDFCHDTEICILIGDVPTCVPTPLTPSKPLTTDDSTSNSISGIYTTGHFTESGTTFESTTLVGSVSTISNTPHYDNLCHRVKCHKGLECYMIDGKPECLPSNYQCMDCWDLLCHLQDLSCKMVLNPSFITDKYGQTCCKFIPTCISR